MAPSEGETSNKFMLPFKQYKEIFDDIRDDSVTIGYYCSKYKSNLQNSQDNPCSNLESKCLIVSMYISKLEELHPNTMIEGCIFLYYMMYDKYIKKNSFGCDMLAFYKASLQDYCVNVDWEECNNFVEQIDVHRFEKYNNLIVLYENFDKLVKSGDDGESNKCSSAGECVQLYEKYIQECLGGVINYYCNELKNFKHDYETKIKELSCTNVPTILTSAESNDLTSIIIFPVIIISALCFISYIVNKFTPFGSWLSLQMDRKKNKYRNIENVTQKYIHSPKPTEGNFQNRPYNVSYNSGQY